MRGLLEGIAVLTVAALAAVAPAAGQSLSLPDRGDAQSMEQFDRDVFFFGGRLHEEYFGQSFIPWTTRFENNYIVGGGYQQFFTRWGPARIGGEIGVADRFTTNTGTYYPGNSGELWAGLVARFDGWDFGPLHVTPAMTAGFSVVTGLIGVEYDRNSSPHSDRLSDGGHFLVYLGPELDFSLPGINPNLEMFWRAQHRSGAFGTIADLDGANADVLGVRWKF